MKSVIVLILLLLLAGLLFLCLDSAPPSGQPAARKAGPVQSPGAPAAAQVAPSPGAPAPAPVARLAPPAPAKTAAAAGSGSGLSPAGALVAPPVGMMESVANVDAAPAATQFKTRALDKVTSLQDEQTSATKAEATSNHQGKKKQAGKKTSK